MPRHHNDLLQWDHNDERHAPGWYVGSEDEDGSLRHDEAGWPFMIYRKSGAPGVSDVAICHGIQNLGDAYEIARMLNQRIGIDRYR